MKFLYAVNQHQDGKSHPTRGAWIEICPAPGAWSVDARRTPHGVRGLKYDVVFLGGASHGSHPTRGAWIEMLVLGGL